MTNTPYVETLRLASDLVAQFEGYRQTSYVCPAGVMTIGYGRTTALNGKGKVKAGEATTEEVERQWLMGRLKEDLDWLMETGLPGLELSAKQAAAILSLIYNIGRGQFAASSLRKGLLTGAGDISLIGSWRAWRKAGGRILEGLIRRREAEIKWFFNLS